MLIIICLLFSAGIDFKTSQSEIYRRQNLTSKVGPRAEMVNMAAF